MFNFFCLLTGDRPRIVDQFGSVSRKKIAMMATGLLLVIGLWAVMAYLIGVFVFQLAPWSTVLMALICSGAVFAVDRSIIQMPHGSKWIILVRVSMALIIALLGGTGLDLVILDGEVRQELVRMHEEERTGLEQGIDLKYAPSMQAAQRGVAQAQAVYNQAEQDFKLEMNGAPQGTGFRGMGKVAVEKKALCTARGQDLHAAEQVLTQLQGKRNAEVQLLGEKQEQASLLPALFERIHALHRYVQRDQSVQVGWLLLTLVIIFFELLPTLAKFAFKETAYEKSHRLMDMLLQRRMEHQAGLREEEASALGTLRNVQQEHGRMRRSA